MRTGFDKYINMDHIGLHTFLIKNEDKGKSTSVVCSGRKKQTL